MGRWLNSPIENSHLPLRRKEHVILRFRQTKTLQKFASAHAKVYNHFNSDRHLTDRQTYKAYRSAALAERQNFAAYTQLDLAKIPPIGDKLQLV